MRHTVIEIANHLGNQAARNNFSVITLPFPSVGLRPLPEGGSLYRISERNWGPADLNSFRKIVAAP